MKKFPSEQSIKLIHHFNPIFFAIFLILVTIGSGVYCVYAVYGAATPGYIPFNRDNTALLLQKTVEAKLIPFVIKGEEMELTITRLLGFSMDWEANRFALECAFTANYQGFIEFSESGEVTLSGCGLLSPLEQKLGVKLLGIEALRLDHFGEIISEAARAILEQNLSGIELWQDGKPVSSEILNKDNFTILLKVAINQILPINTSDGSFSVTLLQLTDLALKDESGDLQARFLLKGTYRKLVTLSFEGEAVIEANVSVAPEAMTGLIRIGEITGLNLKNTPGFLDGIISGLINTKMKGKEITFNF